MKSWAGKRYYSLDAWCKEVYGEKLYKIAINAGFTCPTRDGRTGTKGCIFCSAKGSGDYAVSLAPHGADSIRPQIEAGLKLFRGKQTGSRFIGYFQAFTNTYGSLSYLETIYRIALDTPEISGISIATRPDVLPPEVLSLLARLRQEYPAKFIWVELGLQTIHERTATYIRRGYPLSVFDQAVEALHQINIPVIVHVILGLPGETVEDMLDTIRYLNTLPIWGVKLQLLHVLKDTDLALDYIAGQFEVLSQDDYLSILIRCIAQLRPDIVLHRVTGDGPRDLLLAPVWSIHKKTVLNELHHRLKAEDVWQGKDWIPYDTGSINSV